MAVKLPPDKSLTHRALLFAAIADGQSVIEHPSIALDCMSTRAAVEAFGVHIDHGKVDGSAVYRLRSPGISRWQTPEHVVDAGNSGTTARLLIGLCSGVKGFSFELKGDDSLMKRPMDRVVIPLRLAGGDIQGPENGCRLPLRVIGKSLTGFAVESKVVSAQVKSALLFAASQASGESTVIVPAGTRDHTERMMKAMGAPLTSEVSGGVETFKFVGPWKIDPFRTRIPRDPSAMAFFAVLAFLNPGLTVGCAGVLANEGRLQFLKHLEEAGLSVTRTPSAGLGCLGESVSDFEFVRTGETKAFHVLAHEVAGVIDEIPALAVAAVVCPSPCTFKGLTELKVKESDRLASIEDLLNKAGIRTSVSEADLEVTPSPSVKGFEYHSLDHRMIMAAAVLATIADNSSTVGPIDAARVSFPLFFERLRQIYG